MREILITFGAIFLFMASTNAQKKEFGYLGKKNLISVYATGNFRFFSAIVPQITDIGNNSYNYGYDVNIYSDDGVLKKRSKIARYDLRLGYTRLLKRGLGIGAEFGYEKFRLARNTASSGYYQTSFHYHSASPVFNVFSTMVTVSFTGRRHLAPTGFVTTAGIGTKFYTFARNENYINPEDGELFINPYPEYKKDFMALNIFLELGYRIPIAKFMVVDLGLRFNSGYVFKMSDEVDSGFENESEWDKDDFHRYLVTENLGTLLTFKLGIGFML